MGDMAAGKKAAAVKAVNEWVKVGNCIYTVCSLISIHLCRIDRRLA